MNTKRMAAIRKKLEDGHYERPEIIAAGAYDLAKGLIGREHAEETRLRWLTMEVSSTAKTRSSRDLARSSRRGDPVGRGCPENDDRTL